MTDATGRKSATPCDVPVDLPHSLRCVMDAPEMTGLRKIVARSLVLWCVLIAAEIIHGMLRALILVPLAGEFRSRQIGVFTGSAIILVIASLTIRWVGATRRTELLTVGAIWLVLTVLFEVLFGRFVAGLTWERIAADYNLWKGGLMPIGLLVLCFSPMFAARLRKSV